MDFSEIESFVAVCREGSFTKAANSLFVSQSALSKRVARLEDECGSRLVRRVGGTVVPTASGEVMLLHAREMLRQRDEATRRLGEMRRGTSALLRIGYLPTTPLRVMAPAVERMAREHPGTDFWFGEVPGIRDPCDEIRQGRMDVVLGLGEGAHPDKRVRTRVYRRTRYCALVPKSHPLASRQQCKPEDLAGERLVLYSGDGIHGYHELSEFLASAGFDAGRVTYVSSHTEKVLMVVAGGCVSIGALGVGMPEEQVSEQVASVPLVGMHLPGGDMVVAYDSESALGCAFAALL